MVMPRRFTATEWRDLARGCRALIRLDDEAIERNKNSTILPQFEKIKNLHLEMVELCEYRATRARDV